LFQERAENGKPKNRGGGERKRSSLGITTRSYFFAPDWCNSGSRIARSSRKGVSVVPRGGPFYQTTILIEVEKKVWGGNPYCPGEEGPKIFCRPDPKNGKAPSFTTYGGKSLTSGCCPKEKY